MDDLNQTEKRLATVLDKIVKNAVRYDTPHADLRLVEARLINEAHALLDALFPTGDIEPEGYRRATDTLPKLVLTRSDQGDGGWSLHPPGTTNDQIASGDVAPLATGTSLPSTVAGKKWARPHAQDYTDAYRSLLNEELRRYANAS